MTRSLFFAALACGAIGFAAAAKGQSDGVSTLDLASTKDGRAAALATARLRGLATRQQELSIAGTWLRLR